jgi:hypothetical protein
MGETDGAMVGTLGAPEEWGPKTVQHRHYSTISPGPVKREVSWPGNLQLRRALEGSACQRTAHRGPGAVWQDGLRLQSLPGHGGVIEPPCLFSQRPRPGGEPAKFDNLAGNLRSLTRNKQLFPGCPRQRFSALNEFY